MHMKYFVIFIFMSREICEAARILCFIPSVAFSHQVAFRPMWNELAKRGHDVVVITTDPQNDPSLNLTEIDINFAYELWNTKYNAVKILDQYKYNPFKLFTSMTDVIFKIYNEELLHPDIQNMLKNETEHFDLVIVEYLFPAVFAFSNRFNCPYIGVTSLDLSNSYHFIMGNPTHPVLYPDSLLPFEGNLTFWERLASTVFTAILFLFDFYRDKAKDEQFIDRHFGKNMPPVSEIMRNVSAILINVDPAFNKRPLGPTTIPIGGGLHLPIEKDLPKDLQEYLNAAENGAIYFSFGTNVKSDHVPLEVRDVILDGLKELPYKVLWKFDIEDIPNLPTNVKLVKWAPQIDILRHPNVKAFITQGGLQSMEEAVFSHVPLVGIPFIADQDSNVQQMVKKGFGIYLNKDTLTKESLKEAVLEVINNPKYKEKLMESVELSKDQPMTGLERGIWWIEYVIRQNGTEHFNNPAMDLPAYQYYLLDVIAAILVSILIVLFIAFKCILLFKCLASRLIGSDLRERQKAQ